MADILGSARVVIRAIDGGVSRDLRRMLRQTPAIGRDAGESMGKAFSGSFGSSIMRGDISKALDGVRSRMLSLRPGAEQAAEAFSSFIRRVNVLNVVISVLAGGVVSLVGGIGALGGAVLGAAGSLSVLLNYGTALVAGFIAVRLATSGLGAAISKMKADGVNPFEGIHEAKADFVAFMVSVQDEMNQLRDTAATAFLPGLQAALQTFFSSVFPTVEKGIAAVGTAMGTAVQSVMNSVAAAQNIAKLDSVFSTSAGIITSLGEALGSVWDASLSIMVAAAPIAQQYVDFVRDRLGSFASYLNTDEGAAKLQDFLTKAGASMAQIGEIFDNVFAGFGKIITANLGPGTGGGYLLNWLDHATDKFASLDTLVGGSDVLQQWFLGAAINAQKVMSAIGALVTELMKLGDMPEIGETFDILAQGAPAMASLISSAADVGPIFARMIVNITETLALFADSGWDTSFFETLGEIVQWVSDLFRTEFAQAIIGTLAPISGMMSAFSLVGILLGNVFIVGVGYLSKFTGAVSQVAGMATSAVSGIAQFTRGITGATGAAFTFAGQVGLQIRSAGVAIGGMATSVGSSMAAFGTALVGGGNAAGTFAGKVGIAFRSLLTSPVFWVIAGIVALGAALVVLYNKFDWFKNAVDSVFAWFGEAWNNIVAMFQGGASGIDTGAFITPFTEMGAQLAPVFAELKNTFVSLMPVFAELGTTLMTTLVPAFMNLAVTIIPLLVSAVGQILTALMPLIPVFIDLVAQILPLVASLIAGLIPAITQVIAAVVPLIASLIGALVPAITAIISAVLPVVSTLISALIPAITAIVEAVLPMVTTLIEALIPAFTAIINAVMPVVTMLIDLLVPIITTVVAAIAPLISIIIDALVPVFTFLIAAIMPVVDFLGTVLVVAIQILVGIIETLISWFTSLFTGAQMESTAFSEAINAAFTWIGDIWNGFMTWVTEAWNGFWNGISTVVSTVWNFIVTVVSTYINMVLSVITAIVTAIVTWWTTSWNAVVTTISTIWTNIQNFVSNGINFVRTIIQNVVTTIVSWWTTSWNNISNVVTNIWNAIKTGVGNAINGVKSVITSVLNAISSVWNSIWTSISNTFKNIWNGITSAISGLKNTISGAFNGVVDIIKGAINGIISLANGAISALNGISVAIPDWVPVVGGSTFGLSIPSIPMLAKGGVVSPTDGGTLALIAEAGRPERVEPLDDQGLSKRDHAIMEMIASAGGRTTTIEVHAAPGMSVEELAEQVSRVLEWNNRH